MSKINQIKIENFQSHSRTSLALHTGVNVVVGPSDSGKSAIIRALCWIVENRPLGESFRRRPRGKSETTSVTVSFSGDPDEPPISRERSNSRNVYKVGSESFAAPGASVPDDIRLLLSLDDINIHKQMDGPFLLSVGNNAEVARTLNKAASLETIDRASSNIAAKIRQTTSEFVRAQGLSSAAYIKLAGLGWVDAADVQIQKAEEKEKDIAESVQLVASVDELLRKIAAVTYELQSARKVPRLPKIDAIISRVEDLQASHIFAGRLSAAMHAIDQTKKELGDAKDLAKRSRREYEESKPATCPTCGQPWKRIS